MATSLRHKPKYAIIALLGALLALFSCSAGRDIAQESAFQAGPIGVYTEALMREGPDSIVKCKYCGRFIRIGDIHRDAASVVDVQVKMGLDERHIAYENGKDQEKYLHVYIYKFEERRGGNFSVERPAGVGFHMHLFDRGTIKHLFVFDEEQHGLLENVFSIGKFLRRGMKFVTVDKLSQEGVEQGLDWLTQELRDSGRGRPQESQKEPSLESK